MQSSTVKTSIGTATCKLEFVGLPFKDPGANKRDVDVYIKSALNGMDVQVDVTSGFVTAPAVLMFLFPHLYKVDPVAVAALLPDAPVAAVRELQSLGGRWDELHNINNEVGDSTMATFWVGLMNRLECYISPHTIGHVAALRQLDIIATDTWGEGFSTRKLLSFALACNMSQCHGQALIGMNTSDTGSEFIQYMEGTPFVDYERRLKIHAALKRGDNECCGDVNLWALLLASSVYNKQPLVPKSITDGVCKLAVRRIVQVKQARSPEPSLYPSLNDDGVSTAPVVDTQPRPSKSPAIATSASVNMTFSAQATATTSAAAGSLVPVRSTPGAPKDGGRVGCGIAEFGNSLAAWCGSSGMIGVPIPRVFLDQTGPYPTLFPCPANNGTHLSAYELSVISAFNASKATEGSVAISVTPASQPILMHILDAYRIESGYSDGVWLRVVLGSMLIALFSGSDPLWRAMCHLVFSNPKSAQRTSSPERARLAELANIKARGKTITEMKPEEFKQIINLVVCPMINAATMNAVCGVDPDAALMLRAFGKFVVELKARKIVKARDLESIENQVLMFFTVLRSPNAWRGYWCAFGFTIDAPTTVAVSNAMAVALDAPAGTPISDLSYHVLPAEMRGRLLAYVVRSLC